MRSPVIRHQREAQQPSEWISSAAPALQILERNQFETDAVDAGTSTISGLAKDPFDVQCMRVEVRT